AHVVLDPERVEAGFECERNMALVRLEDALGEVPTARTVARRRLEQGRLDDPAKGRRQPYVPTPTGSRWVALGVSRGCPPFAASVAATVSRWVRSASAYG